MYISDWFKLFKIDLVDYKAAANTLVTLTEEQNIDLILLQGLYNTIRKESQK